MFPDSTENKRKGPFGRGNSLVGSPSISQELVTVFVRRPVFSVGDGAMDDSGPHLPEAPENNIAC
jgi:hypothetical protein